MVEVLCHYRTINGTMGSDFLGLAVTSREVREMIWADAERNYGKDVVLQKSGDRWNIYRSGVKIDNEWYATRLY